MKKTSALLTFMTIIYSSLSAQNFAPLNAKWHFQNYSINSNELVSFFTASVDNDTIIEDRYTTVLSLYEDGMLIPQADIYINEQEDKVYFYEDDDFKLIFDFNLNVGDTLVFSIPKNSYYYDITCGYVSMDSTNQISRARIDSITTELIDNENLNVFHTSLIESSNNEFSNWHLNKIIERIGSLDGIFGYSSMQCLGGNPGHFRCYTDSLIEYQGSTEECDYSTSISEVSLELNEIVLFPNPTTNTVSLKFQEVNKYELRIFNEIGQTVFYKQVQTKADNETQSFELNLNNGLYFVTLNSKGKILKRTFQVIN